MRGYLNLLLCVVVVVGDASCQRAQEQAASPVTPGGASAWLACKEFEPLARDVDRGLLSDAEFRSGVRRVYDVAVATPSDVSRHAEELLRVVTQGGTAQAWRQALLGLAESCQLVMSTASK